MKEFKGKNALVTGGGHGIGKAIALKLAENGANIVLVGRNQEILEQTASEISEFKVKVICVVSDITNSNSAKEVFEYANKELGTIDILINNAGIVKDKLAIKMTNQEWQDVINTNLNAQFYYAREALTGMLKKHYGRIINITSVTGITGNPGQANYTAAKAGLNGLTKTLALEYASRGITVNAVAPGYTRSALSERFTEKQMKAILDTIPMERIGEAEEVAELVCFLASSKASYITGQEIAIDGGFTVR